MSGPRSDRARNVESMDELVAYFQEAETPVADFRIGTEHEKIGVYRDDLARVPYEGDRGIGALLERIASESPGWERVREGANLIALQRDGASITLEPGGQIELSGAPRAESSSGVTRTATLASLFWCEECSQVHRAVQRQARIETCGQGRSFTGLIFLDAIGT